MIKDAKSHNDLDVMHNLVLLVTLWLKDPFTKGLGLQLVKKVLETLQIGRANMQCWTTAKVFLNLQVNRMLITTITLLTAEQMQALNF